MVLTSLVCIYMSHDLVTMRPDVFPTDQAARTMHDSACLGLAPQGAPKPLCVHA